MPTAQQPIVVVGGSVAGLASALALARAGHQVTVLERDAVAVEGDAEAAFAGERRGAPQAHQTHGLLARLRVELARLFPDVLDALHAAGAYDLSTTRSLPDSQPGDDALSVIIVRRTTFEWVLRRAVLHEPGVVHLAGAAVEGLHTRATTGGVPVVDGAVLHDGSVVPGTVVLAGGRRHDVPAWCRPLGVDIPEAQSPTGLVYLTRWYHLDAHQPSSLDAKLGGDLGYCKYLAVPGDGGTLSATIAVRSRDHELRAALLHGEHFDHAFRRLLGAQSSFADALRRPITDVLPMGGLINRLRRFTDGGVPLVAGVHAVGDAHTCTNPIYGRGCSLAVVQAGLLAQAMAAHPGDPGAQVVDYESRCRTEVEPWYHLSVQMDEAGRQMARAAGAGASNPLATLFVRGGADPVVGRALLKVMNLLARPEDVMQDPEVVQRAMELLGQDAAPVEELSGPTRDELLGSVAA